MKKCEQFDPSCTHLITPKVICWTAIHYFTHLSRIQNASEQAEVCRSSIASLSLFQDGFNNFFCLSIDSNYSNFPHILHILNLGDPQ